MLELAKPSPVGREVSDERCLADRYTDSLNTHDLEAVHAVLAPEMVFDEMGGEDIGRDAFLAWLDMVYEAIPDVQVRAARVSAPRAEHMWRYGP